MTQSSQSSSTNPTFVGQRSLSGRIPSWRLWVPLLFQTSVILAAPAVPFYTVMTGKSIVLQTVPVDPYDFLRGYSQTLSYDISSLDTLRRLPGWKQLLKQQVGGKSINVPPPAPSSEYLVSGTRFYVILEAPASNKSSSPKPWKPVRVSSDRPAYLPDNQIALKGKSTGNSIEYGLETYYMPENRRDEINNDISQARGGKQRQPIVMEVKVDTLGRAVPISFWVSDRNYRF
ncbi:GDYXXLXY domain-containing protein [Funiculus sociatus]|uniref:GDYXXLXY domain-containing protein n=1 Tax=Funiculus sociatus TaxID=450527 RepID=UPI003296AF1C